MFEREQIKFFQETIGKRTKVCLGTMVFLLGFLEKKGIREKAKIQINQWIERLNGEEIGQEKWT